jgi:hypothetical protein
MPESQDVITMFEIGGTIFVGPLLVDEGGRQIVCMYVGGKTHFKQIEFCKIFF